MWQIMVGFSIGVYVGTYYNCKPILNEITQNIQKYIPEKKG